MPWHLRPSEASSGASGSTGMCSEVLVEMHVLSESGVEEQVEYDKQDALDKLVLHNFAPSDSIMLRTAC